MKITYTIACLLGLAAADEPVWKLSSVLGHKDDQDVQNGYGSYSTDAANARPPYKSTVQILSESDKVIEKHPTYNAWESIKDGAADGKYRESLLQTSPPTPT